MDPITRREALTAGTAAFLAGMPNGATAAQPAGRAVTCRARDIAALRKD